MMTDSKKRIRILLNILQDEKDSNYSEGIYHKTITEFTYHSNHIEGNQLTLEQVSSILKTNTIFVEKQPVNVDDVIETVSHFHCVDLIIEKANRKLTENFIKELHLVLKTGTSDSKKDWFVVGDYKKLPNEVGGTNTTLPEEVHSKIKELLQEYNKQ